jgi:hypothetical protein
MRIASVLAVSTALVISATAADARDYRRHHHHGHGNGAAVGAALGAGVFLGALAASSANAREEIYVDAPPPPPPPAIYGGYRDRGAETSRAVEACRAGLLSAARKYGAFDAEIGDIYSADETPYGYQVRAEITVDYPEGPRTSDVVCETEDGFLVSARAEY